MRTTESDRCQDASSEEPRRQPSDPAEYLSCDASPEQSEMSQRRSRWQGCRRFSRSWNTGSSFFGSSMRFTFENDCPHDDVPKLLRSTASDPLPSDGDEALLAKDIKNRPRSRAEPLRSDVTELRPHSLEPLPAARDESHPVKIVRKRTNTPLVPAARPDTSLTPERLPQGTKRKISPLTITPDKIPPLVSDVQTEIGLPTAKPQSAAQATLARRVTQAHSLLQMLKKTNETQVAKAVMDLTYDDEHSGATEKVFCEMIDKRHLQIQKFSSKGRGMCMHVCAGMRLCARTCMRAHVRARANCHRQENLRHHKVMCIYTHANITNRNQRQRSSNRPVRKALGGIGSGPFAKSCRTTGCYQSHDL